MTQDVDPETFYLVGKRLYELAGQMYDAFAVNVAILGETGAMAGSDDAGTAWAASYDARAREITTVPGQEEQVDSTFSFLSSSQSQLLEEILSRRNSALLARIQQTHAISRADAEEIIATLSEEFTDNLDDDWEPNDYGRDVNSVLARFNAARISEWPE